MDEYSESVIDIGLDGIQIAAEEAGIDVCDLNENSKEYKIMWSEAMFEASQWDDGSSSLVSIRRMTEAAKNAAERYIEDVPLRR